jgi:hypothetical protein
MTSAILRFFALVSLLLTAQAMSAQFVEELKIDSTEVPEAEDQKMQITVTDFRSKMIMEADVMIKGLNPRKTVHRLHHDAEKLPHLHCIGCEGRVYVLCPQILAC